jgi:hypothetical protein
MSDQPKPDPKEIISSFNQLIRNQRASQRVSWRPSSSLDPEVQRTDRDNLNAALRKAGGHGDPEDGGEPYRWKSLKSADKREEGSS